MPHDPKIHAPTSQINPHGILPVLLLHRVLIAAIHSRKKLLDARVLVNVTCSLVRVTSALLAVELGPFEAEMELQGLAGLGEGGAEVVGGGEKVDVVSIESVDRVVCAPLGEACECCVAFGEAADLVGWQGIGKGSVGGRVRR